ncbi:MAG: hypothetical protein IPK99_17620 [Flavobacteriales bacterium]|nr:hypothetical protein [Flavobacteriales bacterium]
MSARSSLTTFLGSRGFVAVALVAHFLFLFALYRTQGIITDLEAEKYIGAAADLLHGNSHDLLHRYPGYGMYVLFLVPFTVLGDVRLAITAQILLGLWAAWALRSLVLRLTGSKAWAQLGGALLLLSYVVQSWTLTLFSEPLISALGIVLIERATRPGGRFPLTALLLMPVVLFARPIGILFVAPVAAYLLLRHRTAPGWVLPAGAIALFVLQLFLPMDRETVIVPIVQGEVVYGFPQWLGAAENFDGRTIAGAQMELIQQHGIWVACKLAVQKAFTFFHLTRPFFSNPIYLFAAIGLFKPRGGTEPRAGRAGTTRRRIRPHLPRMARALHGPGMAAAADARHAGRASGTALAYLNEISGAFSVPSCASK